jgi:hypothetical protein
MIVLLNDTISRASGQIHILNHHRRSRLNQRPKIKKPHIRVVQVKTRKEVYLMVFKNCPICKEPVDDKGLCGCDPPFNLTAIPLEQIYSFGYDLLQLAKEYFKDKGNMKRFKEWEKEYERKKAAGTIESFLTASIAK